MFSLSDMLSQPLMCDVYFNNYILLKWNASIQNQVSFISFGQIDANPILTKYLLINK